MFSKLQSSATIRQRVPFCSKSRRMVSAVVLQRWCSTNCSDAEVADADFGRDASGCLGEAMHTISSECTSTHCSSWNAGSSFTKPTSTSRSMTWRGISFRRLR